MLQLRIFFVACAIFNNYANCGLENNATIIIIGAGASGIAAATRLLENNFTDVKVLEAEDRIGGRIHSVKFGDAFVDLGAEYCHGEEGNIVFSLVNEFGLLKSYKPEYELYYSANGQEVGVDVHESLFSLAHCILHRKNFNANESDICLGMISVGTCLKTRFNELVNCTKGDYKSLLKLSYTWLRSYKSATESCLNLDDVSLISDYEECEGDQMLDWRGLGFRTVLDIMMRKHSAQSDKSPLDVNVLLKNKVLRIVNWQNGSKVDLELQGGQQYSADHVIFTPSLGVLKANHGDLFAPSLPKEKIFAIDNIGYGVLVKIAFYFEKPWWMIHGPRMWGCIWSSEHNIDLEKKNLTWVKNFVAFTAAPQNLNVLMAWFAGETTLDIEFVTDYDILRGVRFILSKCFIAYPGLDVPKNVLRSKWWRNPNFSGTFSYDSVKGFSTGDRGLRDKLGSPILNENGVPTLLFAGEATHRTMFATVHGAIESGYRVADRLINYYENRT